MMETSEQKGQWRTRVVVMWSILTAAIGAVGGHVLTDVINFQSENRAMFRKEYDEAQIAYKDMFNSLRLFSEQAKDKAKVPDSEKVRFQEKITFLHQSMKDVSVRFAEDPELSSDFRRFEQAISRLQKAAVTFTNSLDASPYVESYSNFMQSYEDLNQKIVESKSNYLKNLF